MKKNYLKVKQFIWQLNFVQLLRQWRIFKIAILFYLIFPRLIFEKPSKNIFQIFLLFTSDLTSLSCSLCSVLADHDTVDEMHFHERSAHTGHQLSTVQSNIYSTALYCIDLLSHISDSYMANSLSFCSTTTSYTIIPLLKS